MKEYSKRICGLDQRILVIPDQHFPYAHPDIFLFLAEIKKQYKPQLIINLGDEVDGHSISFHESDSRLFNADKELDNAVEDIHRLRDMFPKQYICESNHGSLIYRRLKHQGIPFRHLVPLPDLYHTPNWSWHHEIIVETHAGLTLFVHGKTKSKGKLAREQMCNAWQGHFHGDFCINWYATTTGVRYDAFAGCLINHESLAFSYGKNNIPKPILGAGWINELGEPVLIRMILDKHGRWTGKL